MAQKWTSAQVENYLRSTLSKSGFDLTPPRENGETGADIIARKGERALFFEAIGYKQSPPARSKDFYEVFFRAISRLRKGATECIIALPVQFGVGLHQRASQYGVAWQRLGDSFPELSVWLVNVDSASHTEHEWNEWGYK